MTPTVRKSRPMSAVTRAKLAKSMRARWRKAKAAGAQVNVPINGHQPRTRGADKVGTLGLDMRKVKIRTVRSEVLDLARAGAELRIIELERELQKLRIFLGR